MMLNDNTGIQQLSCDVCIVGAGPAGMMAAIKLTQYGLKVILLERSPSFPAAREFRGESISQQSIAIFEDLRVLPQLAKYNYLETEQMKIVQGAQTLLKIDFNQLPFKHKCPIDIPQPILLNELFKLLNGYANFSFIKGANCTALIEEHGVIKGVEVTTAQQHLRIASRLVVGADGRYTRTRKLAQLEAHIKPANRDVIWFKVPRPTTWGNQGRIMMKGAGSLIVLPTYPDLLRIGLSIASGTFKTYRHNGLKTFHTQVAEFDAELGALAKAHVHDTDDLSLLDIFTARVPKWYRPGFVLIGDAAHTLSPILGQGVNQSILDATYLALAVYKPLTSNPTVLAEEHLRVFQTQREKQVRFIHQFQARQEWLIHLSAWYAQPIRSAFYRLINHLPRVRASLASKLYYSEEVAQYLCAQDKLALSLRPPVAVHIHAA